MMLGPILENLKEKLLKELNRRELEASNMQTIAYKNQDWAAARAWKYILDLIIELKRMVQDS